MKKIIIILLFATMAAATMAQAPMRFLYQSVVRDANGVLICDRTVGVRLTLLQGSANGASLYVESFTTQTNAYGLYSVEVGVSGDLSQVDWTNGPFFARSEVDVQGGTNYTVEVVDELHSVPFAHSVTLANAIPGIVQTETDPVYRAWDKDWNDITNRPVNVSTWINDAGYITGYTEVQVLSIGHDTIYLTGGSFVKLPEGFSGDYNDLINKPGISAFNNNAGYLTGFNEVQALSLSHDTIFLTGGSFVVLPLVAESQGLASVAGFGHSADSSQLKNLADPTDPQDVVTIQYLDSLIYGYTHIDRGTHNISVADECDKVFWNGLWYTQSGTYTYSYSDSEGFFSTDTLFLTIRHGDHHTLHHTSATPYTWHGSEYASTGTYYYAYTSNNGCPGIDTLHLTIIDDNPLVCTKYRQAADTSILYACEETYWHGQRIRSSGIYEHQMPARYGQACDSVARVQVVIYNTFRLDTAIHSNTPISWRGNTYSRQGNYSDTLIDANFCDSIYNLHLIMNGDGGIGCAPGKYTVAPGLQVAFAQGNLLFQSANNRWMFATEQYEQFNDNCVGEYYRPYTDVFRWATSGYHNNQDSLNNHYRPWDSYNTSATVGSFRYRNNRYGYGPSSFMPDTNLVDSSANYDWGMFNPIINGGKGSGEWITLSAKEWDYLFNLRPNASQLYSVAQLTVPSQGYHQYNTTIYGLIILEDTWVRPTGISFTPHASYTWENSFTLSQWKTLEASGAIFLPNGNYWTTNSFNSGNAYALNTNFVTPTVAPYNKSNLNHVRLAQYTYNGMTRCKCSYFDTLIVSSGPYTWHGHTITRSGDYMDTLVNAAGCDSLVFYSLITEGSGRLDSLFSVGPGQKVYFSNGNLQYNPHWNKWRFAPTQYDYMGTYNRYVTRDTANRRWIDLFGWATSGYHDSTDNLNTAYRPYSYQGSFGPSTNMSEQSLVNESRQYDWGVHNSIANGGNAPDQWRTLTSAEWYYLYYSRPRAAQLRRRATVMGVMGLLLLPDNWTSPAGFSFNAENVYGGGDWALLESGGAVFLPAAGYGSYSSSNYIGDGCYYWSTTAKPYSSSAYYFIENPRTWPYYGTDYTSRSYRMSVRLVKDY